MLITFNEEEKEALVKFIEYAGGLGGDVNDLIYINLYKKLRRKIFKGQVLVLYFYLQIPIF